MTEQGTMSEQEVFDALKYHIEVSKYGTRRYFNNAGQLHRTNGPAIEYYTGEKFWYQNGDLHRIDGPAIEWRNGVRFWHINGRMMTESEFNQAVKLL